jgi:hypothetical protein
VADVALSDIRGRELNGDDADGAALSVGGNEQTVSPMRDGYRMVWQRPNAPLKARTATQFVFRVEDANGRPAEDMGLYMGMAGHAEFVSADASIFAHVHPDGSVPMAALMLTRMPMLHAGGSVAPVISFPYGFPKPGRYRIFVQVARAGRPETGVFDALVE